MDEGKKTSDEVKQKELIAEFNHDTQIIAGEFDKFIRNIHPAYLHDNDWEILNLTYKNSNELLDRFTFFKILSCTTGNADDIYDFLSEKMEKFYTAMYAIARPIIYGVVSSQGTVNIIIGLYDDEDNSQVLKTIIEGLLDGIELMPFEMSWDVPTKKEAGLISAIPSVKIGEEYQKFSLASMMKSLNGQDYIVLFISRPVSQKTISQKMGDLIQIKDRCFAVSKRNLSRQQGKSRSDAETNGTSSTDTNSSSRTEGSNYGLSFILTSTKNKSTTDTKSHSETKSHSKTITDTVNNSEGISADVQNGFAIELMNYADQAMERFRQGTSNGMWETVISYSTDSKMVAGIIRASVLGEFAKPNPKILPATYYELNLSKEEVKSREVLVPKILKDNDEMSPLCTIVTSEELGLMCTLPDVPVPNFDLRQGQAYPLITDKANGVNIGFVTDGQRVFKNMPFSLSYNDLARHTFISGITGSGKTTTVKRILKEADTPFLVIESAKKEYRNIRLNDGKNPTVYTLGKPEINCLRFNPFYIQCGVSPQMHIDLLKDLFNASFSFYGPMPYILETCLQNIYKKKGWNLTLGFHPYLANIKNSADLYDAEHMREKYATEAHKFLFPTMQDLKTEIERYVEEELDYEGEVAGNVKTAIKARLAGLCTGSKGYMFNTYEYADMDKILNEDTVFELEGVADDADKAFCLGLLIIFINEYRQITQENEKTNLWRKEYDIEKSKDLSHILVIEEAHRLLKNVETERTSEDMGNPKGKAVEHFTNMIAEMRSYGQGVIVAEQIPSKLAPDVIKNSSNKIIQRLVAADDQEIIGNTIGLPPEESLDLGTLTTGTALCHKEGMALPVRVKIPESDPEIEVSDGDLYMLETKERLHRINVNIAKEALVEEMKIPSLKLLDTVLIQGYDSFKAALSECRKIMRSTLVSKDVELVICENENAVYGEVLLEPIIKYLLNGVYSVKQIISDDLYKNLKELLISPTAKKFDNVKVLLKKAYNDDPAYKGNNIIAQLIYNKATPETDLIKSIRQYFFNISSGEIMDILKMINRRGGR